MEPHTEPVHQVPETPPDCFPLSDLEVFQSFENQSLADVNYFLWLNLNEPSQPAYRFLYFLELVFDSQESLLLTSGEDSEAIRVSSAAVLVETARELAKANGQITIQRLNAGAFPLWQPAIGKALQGIRLSRSEQGFYRNDALLLDFGAQRVLVQLGPKEGLELAPHDL